MYVIMSKVEERGLTVAGFLPPLLDSPLAGESNLTDDCQSTNGERL